MPLIRAAEKDLFFIEDGLLRKHYESPSTKRRWFPQRQVVVPLSLRKKFFKEGSNNSLL
jgi:hypothetical protein